MNSLAQGNGRIINEIKHYVTKMSIYYDRTEFPEDWKITTIHGPDNIKTVVVGECLSHVVDAICDELDKYDLVHEDEIEEDE